MKKEGPWVLCSVTEIKLDWYCSMYFIEEDYMIASQQYQQWKTNIYLFCLGIKSFFQSTVLFIQLKQ